MPQRYTERTRPAVMSKVEAGASMLSVSSWLSWLRTRFMDDSATTTVAVVSPSGRTPSSASGPIVSPWVDKALRQQSSGLPLPPATLQRVRAVLILERSHAADEQQPPIVFDPSGAKHSMAALKKALDGADADAGEAAMDARRAFVLAAAVRPEPVPADLRAACQSCRRTKSSVRARRLRARLRRSGV